MLRLHRRLGGMLALALVARASSAGSPAPVPAAAVDTAWLEEVEEATESFGNALHELSLEARGGDATRLARFFSAQGEWGLPGAPGPVRPERKWILARDWSLRGPEPAPRESVLVQIGDLLRRFSSRDDVRFELTSSTVSVGEGGAVAIEARFDGSIVGRNRAGRREWLRGAGTVAGRRDGSAWTIDRLAWDSAASLVATRDFFTDVTGPAGVALEEPGFLESGGSGLPACGAAAADVDRDGFVDVFAVGRTGNRLYLNRGDGTFRDSAAAAGLSVFEVPGSAPLWLDLEGDGDLDLFVSAVGRQSLFENRLVPDGRLFFRDVSATSGVGVESAAFSAAAGDVNADGRPDIHVACYNHYGQVAPDRWDGATNGLPDLLFLSQPDGTFREAAKAWGVADPRWGYSSVMVDVDEDGRLDVYVANDFAGGNGLFLRRGDRFVDASRERGVFDGGYCMGVSFGDHDNDGDLDLHVSKVSSTVGRRVLGRFSPTAVPEKSRLEALANGNGLYENVGGGRYRDVTAEAGPLPGGWAWGGGFLDHDGDGFADLYTPNGFVSGASSADTASLFWRQVVGQNVHARDSAIGAFFERQVGLLGKGWSFTGHERDFFAVNRGDGTFMDLSGVSGIDSPSDGRSAVLADFDNDGDTDVFLRSMFGSVHQLFRNDLGQASGFVRVALEGRTRGRDAFGAVVRVKTSAGIQAKVKEGGAGFLAQADPRLLFGLGQDARAEWVEITWPGGDKQRFPGPAAGTSWHCVEGEQNPRVVVERRFRFAPPPPHR